MGERYYDPALAHFTQRDPLNQINDLTQANRYAYVSGNPVNLVDPTAEGIVDVAKKVVSKVKRGVSVVTAVQTCFAYKYVTTPRSSFGNGDVQRPAARTVIRYAYDCSIGYLTG
jgi:hypothetical protein